MAYIFQSAEDTDKLTGSSKICNIINDFTNNEASKKAANALVDYIRQAEAVDYAHKAYYMDGPAVLEFGVNGGVPYYNEKELELSEKEFSELYAKLYGL